MKQFTMKVSAETKQKLETLSSDEKYRYCYAKVIRDLINKAHDKCTNE
jgi:hypothetical protein